ncbi:putative house-cleaning noncanonical NTP pyrophosphatase (MazG superfamily) [Thermosporothrix hazakensis]|jgi:predicted house-cleaning noncanonical NTP pyrophosphatase (MazG superfamily)|uniref:Phosphoribosyl-ATP pyrophosphohydrolase n=2 Tax=Thermosporothrix TaxID=768650 RepID=A0A455SQE0_9CHLR|nr:nucleoside triphosphate pyrophosphohydrolase [Thermosporothrix hazakensis]PZW26380.1 putative house-cleaning noncanonical NTP pyrophosphatase (MazG superfamily) [Thermosporothrix hazakensis]BBH90617.1 phosphoribosyl-ATP pyrophosphohydrolase [Thermosporothrix sp. COM3]GCE48668.1 phosphoribosyl-ATP pyrophosphohydrolase [Thermosporothrix hazakensis]
MQKEYNKLVRDRIPEMIEANGATCQVTAMDEAEYQQTLHTKLVEEALEVAAAKQRGELIKELADLQEVVSALQALYQIDPAEVQAVQEQRRNERGAFERRLRLISVQIPDESYTN